METNFDTKKQLDDNNEKVVTNSTGDCAENYEDDIDTWGYMLATGR